MSEMKRDERLSALQELMGAPVPRLGDHVTVEEATGYAMDLLTPEATREVGHHLSFCKACFAAYVGLDEELLGTKAEPTKETTVAAVAPRPGDLLAEVNQVLAAHMFRLPPEVLEELARLVPAAGQVLRFKGPAGERRQVLPLPQGGKAVFEASEVPVIVSVAVELPPALHAERLHLDAWLVDASAEQRGGKPRIVAQSRLLNEGKGQLSLSEGIREHYQPYLNAVRIQLRTSS